MSQDRQINPEAIVIKKARQDREQAADLDDIITILYQQKQRIADLEAQNKELSAKIQELSPK